MSENSMKKSRNRGPMAPIAITVATVTIAIALVVVGVFSWPDASRPASIEEANMKTVVIPVEGMTCVACAARVKKALTSIDGVGDVQVGLAEGGARVSFDQSRVTNDQLIVAIDELGYDAGTPTEAR